MRCVQLTVFGRRSISHLLKAAIYVYRVCNDKRIFIRNLFLWLASIKTINTKIIGLRVSSLDIHARVNSSKGANYKIFDMLAA